MAGSQYGGYVSFHGVTGKHEGRAVAMVSPHHHSSVRGRKRGPLPYQVDFVCVVAPASGKETFQARQSLRRAASIF